MAFKKTFFIVVPLLLGIFLAFPCMAGWEFPQMLNFGIIKKRYENNNAVVTISPDGSMSYPSSIDTAEGYCQGILRYNILLPVNLKLTK